MIRHFFYADSFKHLLQRLVAPDFWVCVYICLSDDMKQHGSGKFCALGKTRGEAEEDARAYIERSEGGMIFGEVRFKIRRPNLAERLFG